jgi:hypothetical protein
MAATTATTADSMSFEDSIASSTSNKPTTTNPMTTTSVHSVMTSAAHRGTPGALGIGLGIGGGIVALVTIAACVFLRCAPSAAGNRGARFRKLDNNNTKPEEPQVE